jgi:protein-L-isoaspartate(D-aspartate) O-methyltransferase
MSYIDFFEQVHRGTKRDYLARVASGDKAAFARIAKKFDFDYWDGDRNTGYGGYRYDGRWRAVAERMAAHYGVKAGDRILDVGCGKGFLLYEFMQAVPGVIVAGVDVSRYALENSKEEVRPHLQAGSAVSLPFPDKSFDVVLSINTLHNLRLPELEMALREIERVGMSKKYILMDGYRTEEEKVNLLYWQLTCECFFTPAEWEWVFQKCGYGGDYGCVFFD